MILALKNGQLIPPATPAEGHKRMLSLVAECSRIEFQLRDRKRRESFITRPSEYASYEQWRKAAEQALRMHNLERRLLGEWLDAQQARLMRKAALLLEALVEDEVEFEDDERAIIDELTAYVRAREVP